MGWTSSKLYDGHAEQVCFLNTEGAQQAEDAPVFICSVDLHRAFATSVTNIWMLAMLLTEKSL